MKGSTIERIFKIRHETLRRQLSFRKEECQIIIGAEAEADLLMDERLQDIPHWDIRESLDLGAARIFGFPTRSSRQVTPDTVKLVYEIHG